MELASDIRDRTRTINYRVHSLLAELRGELLRSHPDHLHQIPRQLYLGERWSENNPSPQSYLYDATGNRLVRKEGGTTTLYLPGGQELTLTTSTGVVKATRYYAWGGQSIAVRTGTALAGVSTLIADPHGTANLSITNTTNVLTQRRLGPYGNPRGGAPAWPGDRGFLDKPTDASGLTQIGARYYDPSVGRFLSVDPVMDLSDPQQWHGYAYANSNPTTYSDPTGLLPGAASIDGLGGAGSLATSGNAPKGAYKSEKKPAGGDKSDQVDPPVNIFEIREQMGKGFISWSAGAANSVATTVPNTAALVVNSNPAVRVSEWEGVPYWTAIPEPFEDEGLYGPSYTIGEWAGPQLLLAAGASGARAGRLTLSSVDNLTDGTRAARVVAPGAATSSAASAEGGLARTLIASEQRAITSLQRNIAEHTEKLAAYRANPDAYDNLGYLQRAPSPEIRQRIIDGRINHLETEIRGWQDQIDKILGGG